MAVDQQTAAQDPSGRIDATGARRDLAAHVLFAAVALGGVVLLAGVYALRTIVNPAHPGDRPRDGRGAARPLVRAARRARARAAGISFAVVVIVLSAFGYLLVRPLVDGRRGSSTTPPRSCSTSRAATAGSDSSRRGFHVVEPPATPSTRVAGYRRRDPRAIRPAAPGYECNRGNAPGDVGVVALSVPYAVALGVIVAIFDLVPLVGATAGTVVVAAVALGTRGFVAASIAVVVMIVYQQLENHVLQQLVYHRTVKLSPLAIALSVAAGAELAGVPGALLGIPFAGALKVVSQELVAYRRGEDAPA